MTLISGCEILAWSTPSYRLSARILLRDSEQLSPFAAEPARKLVMDGDFQMEQKNLSMELTSPPRQIIGARTLFKPASRGQSIL